LPPFEAQAEAFKTCLTFIDQWVRLSDLVWDISASRRRDWDRRVALTPAICGFA
jgi:hypothetical protein